VGQHMRKLFTHIVPEHPRMSRVFGIALPGIRSGENTLHFTRQLTKSILAQQSTVYYRILVSVAG
jgi:hypothetical protein